MSGGFTKARMILVTKVLIANKSFLEKFVSNSTLPVRSIQYTRAEINTSSIFIEI